MAIYRMSVNLKYRIGSTAGMNTWHVRSTAVPTPPTPSIPTAIKTFYTAIAAYFPNDMTFSWDGTLHDVSSTDPAVAPQNTPWTVTGTGSPANYGVAGTGFCVTWRSGTATRSGRGRTFLAPVHATVIDTDGTPVAAPLTAVRNAANALVATSLADGNGAVSVFSLGTPTAPGKIGRDVQAATVNDKFAWLSSRRG
jgi:hypothetical protein